MANLKKIVHSRTKVRFQDSDPFNHLNNSKYIDYMMNAREDQIQEHYDLDLFDLGQNRGLGWVVATNQISYINSANTMEDLFMDSQLAGHSSKHLDVEVRMWNKDRTQLKAFLWARFVHVNLRTKKVSKHPEDLMDLFDQVVLPLEDKNFDARNQYWRANAKQEITTLV
jgi:thioesterase-3